jgi:hypothetical protein
VYGLHMLGRYTNDLAYGVSMGARRSPRVAAAAGVGLIWAGVSAWLALDWTARIRDWAVMSDEMLYVKLAISVADTWSPLPRLHGTSVGVINQLYPLLLAPFFGPLSVPAAFHDAHLLNAALMASACVPAYLIARRLVGRWWSLAVSLLSVTVPWMVLSGVLMTEVVAYPAFLWAMLSCLHALRSPGAKGDAIAVAGLVLAVLARAQFLALAPVLAVAVLVDAALTRTPWRTVLARHRVLAGGYLVAGALLLAVALTRSIGNALGVYSPTLHGSPLPSGVWQAGAAHLDAVGVGCGLVPLLLGGGWMLAAVVRPLGREAQRFAVLSLLTIAALTMETASYDLRFGGVHIVRDRYLFYVVPLLLGGSAAVFAEPRRRSTATGVAAMTAFFAATVHWLDFPTTLGSWVDSPIRVLNGTLTDQSGALTTSGFVAVAGLCLGVVLVVWLAALPPAVLGVAAVAFLLPFTVLTARKQIDTVASGKGTSGRPVAGPPGTVLDWIDSVLPRDATVAMIPFPQSPAFALDAVRWWDVEFWNRTVQRTLVGPGGLFSYAPFPNTRLRPDWRTGAVPGTDGAPAYVVFALEDTRFRIAGVQHAQNLGLRVIVADRPYRLRWMTRGLDADGWARPGRPVTVRVYSQRDAPELVGVRLPLGAPASAPARYVARAGGDRASGEVSAGGLATLTFRLCVPGRGSAEITLTTESVASIPGPPLAPEQGPRRGVGAHLGPVSTSLTGRTCTP